MTPLQRGRGRETAEGDWTQFGSMALEEASTRPRSGDRGGDAGTADEVTGGSLQRGRGRETAEGERKPSHFSAQLSRLQRGRGRETAEGLRGSSRQIGVWIASTRPRSGDRGGRFWRAAMRMIQSGFNEAAVGRPRREWPSNFFAERLQSRMLRVVPISAEGRGRAAETTHRPMCSRCPSPLDRECPHRPATACYRSRGSGSAAAALES